MSRATFKITPYINLHLGPRLEFEIKGLDNEQEKIVRKTFEVMFNSHYEAGGADPLDPDTKVFISDVKTGDEARMFFGALQELGVEFNSPTLIREDILAASKKLIKMQGLQK